jgi:hypothetical protein
MMAESTKGILSRPFFNQMFNFLIGQKNLRFLFTFDEFFANQGKLRVMQSRNNNKVLQFLLHRCLNKKEDIITTFEVCEPQLI